MRCKRHIRRFKTETVEYLKTRRKLLAVEHGKLSSGSKRASCPIRRAARGNSGSRSCFPVIITVAWRELATTVAKERPDIQNVLDQQTDAWGIKVSNVEIKHVDLNESMVRAIAKQAEAERTRRAKVIHAEGEMQAAEKLLQAAQTLSQQSQALQLRYLQTLTDIAGERTNTIVFPLPMDLIDALMNKTK